MVIGIIRHFEGTPQVVRNTYVTRILNFRIQTTAALILSSAQAEVTQEVIERGLQSKMMGNVYDSLIMDLYPGEECIVDQIIAERIPSSWYLTELKARLPESHHVPVAFESKIL